ncbi:hypothetical protein AK812_SmicGene46907 [Symbiodinium microadriaticum]|uniref:Uncharacterized protein n=1 Tax=Symbiodinium microadriaticum TaxID=2951 RepID=A0A1Q9BT24_SYMMI|nr:hypothetical protein AK812_SmicGene46907 [Symbiodinium microadriaticum]
MSSGQIAHGRFFLNMVYSAQGIVLEPLRTPENTHRLTFEKTLMPECFEGDYFVRAIWDRLVPDVQPFWVWESQEDDQPQCTCQRALWEEAPPQARGQPNANAPGYPQSRLEHFENCCLVDSLRALGLKVRYQAHGPFSVRRGNEWLECHGTLGKYAAFGDAYSRRVGKTSLRLPATTSWHSRIISSPAAMEKTEFSSI